MREREFKTKSSFTVFKDHYVLSEGSGFGFEREHAEAQRAGLSIQMFSHNTMS